MALQIGLDSQCLSYLIDIMRSTSRISKAVGCEQLSLIRIYLYTGVTFWVTPKINAECKRICDQQYRELHEDYMNTLFGVLPINDTDRVSQRAKVLYDFHNKLGDCIVLAEAEEVKHDYLLTFDTDFTKRLSNHCNNVKLLSASSYWSTLGIPKGSNPSVKPHSTNPLSEQDFWLW